LGEGQDDDERTEPVCGISQVCDATRMFEELAAETLVELGGEELLDKWRANVRIMTLDDLSMTLNDLSMALAGLNHLVVALTDLLMALTGWYGTGWHDTGWLEHGPG
jgi:PleD family two-component response regulator